jgi:hypothetical protein
VTQADLRRVQVRLGRIERRVEVVVGKLEQFESGRSQPRAVRAVQ